MQIKDENFFREWAKRMYRAVDEAADDKELESFLRNVCIEGTAKRQQYGVSLCRSLANIKTPNRYLRYFLLRAKEERAIGGRVFWEMHKKGATQFTNEYLFATHLKDYVKPHIVHQSVEVLSEAGLSAFQHSQS